MPAHILSRATFQKRVDTMEVASREEQLRKFEAQVLRCRDVEALQDLAIRLFAENQGRSAVYEDLLQSLTLRQ